MNLLTMVLILKAYFITVQKINFRGQSTTVNYCKNKLTVKVNRSMLYFQNCYYFVTVEQLFSYLCIETRRMQ